MNSKCSEAYYNKAVALASLGKKEEALLSYTQAINNNPKYEKAIHNKGILLSDQGKR